MMRVIVALALLLPFHAVGAPLPDTEAGTRVAAWLDAFNSASPEKMKAFSEKYRWQMDLERLKSFRQFTGGFEVLRVDESEPSRIVVLIKERESERAGKFHLTVVEDGESDKMRIEIRPTPLPPEFAVPRLTMPEAVEALEKFADERAARDEFAGALLVAARDQILLEKAWGKSDRAEGSPNRIDTQFRLGSMNKMFTAVATLQLVERGKLSLDGTVGKYIPDYPNEDVSKKVTIRHLLTHTGGTGDIFGPDFDAHRLSLKTHSDYVRLFGERAPLFDPGSEERYSNYGYVLLGEIIESVSGVSYYEYVHKHVFLPAGMRSTDSLPESEKVIARSHGYTKRDEKWVSNADTLPPRGMAAGGGYSTVGDLLRFARALQAGSLLSKELFAEALRPQNLTKSYGYGFGVSNEGALLMHGHNGGAPGMNGELRFYPNLDYVVVALSNLDPPAASRMAEYFEARMPIQR
jgi:D-alanyl-D-alanine carboxypeptidase